MFSFIERLTFDRYISEARESERGDFEIITRLREDPRQIIDAHLFPNIDAFRKQIHRYQRMALAAETGLAASVGASALIAANSFNDLSPDKLSLGVTAGIAIVVSWATAIRSENLANSTRAVLDNLQKIQDQSTNRGIDSSNARTS